MRLNDKKFWLVSDTSTPNEPEWVDVVSQSPHTFQDLVHIILGTGRDTWVKENTAVYDNKREAEADALKRLAKRGLKRDPKHPEGVSPIKKKAYSYDRTKP